jgi:hypothetical protein
MNIKKISILAVSISIALSMAAPGHAAVVTVGFSGTLTSAENNVYSDPTIPTSDFFKVGQAFSGNFSYDTSSPGYTDSGFKIFDLKTFDVFIGGVDFSTRFIPRDIVRSSDGAVSFSAGGADQGGSTSIDLNLNSSYANYPTAAELTGNYATFNFNDYYPLGGVVSGRALLNAGGVISPVPEADTWAMMIFGMGAVGLMMRRRVRASEVKFNGKIKRISEGEMA